MDQDDPPWVLEVLKESVQPGARWLQACLTHARKPTAQATVPLATQGLVLRAFNSLAESMISAAKKYLFAGLSDSPGLSAIVGDPDGLADLDNVKTAPEAAARAPLVRFLDGLEANLTRAGLPLPVRRAVTEQLTRDLGVSLFNAILSSPELCTPMVGEHTSALRKLLGSWAKARGGGKIRDVPQMVNRALKDLLRAGGLLAKKGKGDLNAEALGRITDLSPAQVHRILDLHRRQHRGPQEDAVPAGVLDEFQRAHFPVGPAPEGWRMQFARPGRLPAALSSDIQVTGAPSKPGCSGGSEGASVASSSTSQDDHVLPIRLTEEECVPSLPLPLPRSSHTHAWPLPRSDPRQMCLPLTSRGSREAAALETASALEGKPAAVVQDGAVPMEEMIEAG